MCIVMHDTMTPNLSVESVYQSALVNAYYIEQEVSPWGMTLRIYNRDDRLTGHIRIDFADGKVTNDSYI